MKFVQAGALVLAAQASNAFVAPMGSVVLRSSALGGTHYYRSRSVTRGMASTTALDAAAQENAAEVWYMAAVLTLRIIWRSSRGSRRSARVGSNIAVVCCLLVACFFVHCAPDSFWDHEAERGARERNALVR